MRGHLNSRHQIILEDKNSNDIIKENETPNPSPSKRIKTDQDEIEPIDVLETETNIVPSDEYENSNVEPNTRTTGYPRSTVSISISHSVHSKYRLNSDNILGNKTKSLQI